MRQSSEDPNREPPNIVTSCPLGQDILQVKEQTATERDKASYQALTIASKIQLDFMMEFSLHR